MKRFAVFFLPLFFLFPATASAIGFDASTSDKDVLRQAIPSKKLKREFLKESKKRSVESLKQLQGKQLQAICERVRERVKDKVEQFASNRESHLERYQNLHSRLTRIVVKLKEKGFDTSQLESDLETLDDLIKTYAEEYQAFIDLLNKALDLSCEEARDNLKPLVQEALAQLREARQARRAIWEFYKDNIRQDIRDLRQQARDRHSASPSAVTGNND